MAFKLIKENVLKANEQTAGTIRDIFSKSGVLAINIISSPGAGKTTLIEKLGPMLKKEGVAFGVITGDCFTSNDARRIDVLGVPVIQINTGNACHIDAQYIKTALENVDITGMDLVIIENVGNLVCPAEFDLGEDAKIALLSVAEGHDKPEKYPLLIRESRVAVINKMDLIEISDFDLDFCEESIRRVNSGIDIMRVSCKKNEGLETIVEWLKEKIKTKKERNT